MYKETSSHIFMKYGNQRTFKVEESKNRGVDDGEQA